VWETLFISKMAEEAKAPSILRVVPPEFALLPDTPETLPRFQPSDFDVYATFLRDCPHFFNKWGSLTLGFNFDTGRTLTVLDYNKPSQREKRRTKGSNGHYVNLKLSLLSKYYYEPFKVAGLISMNSFFIQPPKEQFFSNQALEMSRILYAQQEQMYSAIKKQRNIELPQRAQTIWFVENFSPLFVMRELLLTTSKEDYLAESVKIAQANQEHNKRVLEQRNQEFTQSVMGLTNWFDYITVDSEHFGFPFEGYNGIHRKDNCMGELKEKSFCDGRIDFFCTKCLKLSSNYERL
jgi:hypothetical protein